MAKTAVHNLLIDDDERLPLIAENEDWEKTITPALVELGQACDSGALNLNSIEAAVLLRVMFESVYVMGHKSGQAEAK